MKNERNTRIYNTIINVDSNSIHDFWEKQAEETISLKSVLLGGEFEETSRILRNDLEKTIVKNLLQNARSTRSSQMTILDIGCGIGRWAYNLKSIYSVYHGIDFSEEFVELATLNFADEKNVNFFTMSVFDMDYKKLLKSYDILIITGVAMYINDCDIKSLFDCCNKLTKSSSNIYFQESVSILPYRLTLKDFYSNELRSKYNAIYRTRQEYEDFFSKYLSSFEFNKEESDLLLDKNTGAREETNARYWFLRKIS
ncbi:MAG: class I SAM-dependent methyltransferase [Bacteroidales bacterium]|jgi:SAM-dependent methyltransferase|nr:class I SAM-dependent methyltransferase [Bacteroidales bacterium]